MRNRSLGTLGTAGLLLLSLALAGCGSSGQSGTRRPRRRRPRPPRRRRPASPCPATSWWLSTDDKKLQTVDNIIPAVNAKAASQPLLDALNKVSGGADQRRR